MTSAKKQLQTVQHQVEHEIEGSVSQTVSPMGYTIVGTGKMASGWWRDNAIQLGCQVVVPEKWTPESVLWCFRNISTSPITVSVSPFSTINSSQTISFVAVEISHKDKFGKRCTLGEDLLQTLWAASIPGSLIIRRDLSWFVIFMLEIPITRKQQPKSDVEKRGLFNRASLGACWLVTEALSSFSANKSTSMEIDILDDYGCPVYVKAIGERNRPTVKRAICSVDGWAVSPMLFDARAICLPICHIDKRRHNPDAMNVLAGRLYCAEELKSYAPPSTYKTDDANVWNFVNTLSNKATFRGVLSRLQSARNDVTDGIANYNLQKDVIGETELNNALASLASFSVSWDETNRALVAAGERPLGVKAPIHRLPERSEESITNTADHFVYNLHLLLRIGEINCALLNGSPPHASGLSPEAAGWRRLDEGTTVGGTTFKASGTRVGWIDLRKRELLLDIRAMREVFRQTGRYRCESLCLRSSTFLKVFDGEGYLLSTRECTRRIDGKDKRVFRIRLDILLKPDTIIR